MEALMKTRKRISEIMAASVGFVLLYATGSKILGLHVFLAQLRRQPFPDWMAYVLLVSLPLSELIVCYLLLKPRLRRIGLLAASGLMLAFTLYVWLGMTGSLGDVPCTCGGLLGTLMDWPTHLVFNIAVTLLAFIGLLFHHQKGGNFQELN